MSASTEIREKAAAALSCSELEVVIETSLGASRPGFRDAIRRSLAGRFPDAAHGLRDLTRVPMHPRFSISVSHGRTMGGYAIVPLPLRIGFDLEEASRVSSLIARRVANDQDAAPPSPGHLWVAKEAAFKCLFLDQQPKTSTKLVVQEWTLLPNEEYLFRAKPLESDAEFDGYGCVLNHEPHLMCFFINRSHAGC